MSCLKCDNTRRTDLTNNTIRRHQEADQKLYYLDPAKKPLLDLKAYPALRDYVRVKGALVGQDATTGYLKMAWEYTDVAAFVAEYVGVLDWSLEPNAATCEELVRKCGGKVAVYSGPGLLSQMLLDAPGVVITGQCIEPTLDATDSFVHPFMVANSGASTSANCIGKVTKGRPGVTVDAVTFTGV